MEADDVKATNTYLVAEVDRLKGELENHYAHLNGMGQQSQQAAQTIRRLEAEVELLWPPSSLPTEPLRHGQVEILKTTSAKERAAASEARAELEQKRVAFEGLMEQRERDVDAMREQVGIGCQHARYTTDGGSGLCHITAGITL